MLKLFRIEAPFWARIRFFGLTTYPRRAGERVIFWLSAIAYSLVYFFLIAFVIVAAVHLRWTWQAFPYNLQEYATTALYDVMYRNPFLFIAFVVVESALIYRAARTRQNNGGRP